MNETFENKTFVNDTKIKRALISVTDKNGIDILARELISHNIEIYLQEEPQNFSKKMEY